MAAQRAPGMAKNLQHGSGAPTWDTRGRLSPAALPQRGAELVRAELVRALPETSGRTSSAAVGEKPAQRPGGQDPPHPWRQVLALPTFPTQLLSSPLAGRGGPRTQTKAWAVPSPPADSPAVPPTPPRPRPVQTRFNQRHVQTQNPAPRSDSPAEPLDVSFLPFPSDVSASAAEEDEFRS